MRAVTPVTRPPYSLSAPSHLRSASAPRAPAEGSSLVSPASGVGPPANLAAVYAVLRAAAARHAAEDADTPEKRPTTDTNAAGYQPTTFAVEKRSPDL
jgi:hypothetical protein